MIAWNVNHRDSISSTMVEIDALGEAGAASGTVIVAAEQTGGRGRAGRAWTAPPGSGLFLSVLFRPDLAVSEMTSLPLLVGVAVAEAIEALTETTCALKWPNDVLIDGGKVAGILVTTRLERDRVRFSNIGIGINCTSTGAELPLGAVSLLSASGRNVSPDELLPKLLNRLAFWLDKFEAVQGRPSLDEWLRRAAFRGESVHIVNDGVPAHGTFYGVDLDGALVLLDDEGTRVRVVSGDLTRGPRPTRIG